MKKLMILAVALFSMTTTFAADENASAARNNPPLSSIIMRDGTDRRQ